MFFSNDPPGIGFHYHGITKPHNEYLLPTWQVTQGLAKAPNTNYTKSRPRPADNMNNQEFFTQPGNPPDQPS
jgi:hypothetical protein